MRDILVLATGKLRRQRMCTEEGRAHADAECAAERAGDAQHLHLAGQIQPIAGLDLDGGDAIRQQGACARQRLGKQGRLIELAGGLQRRDDAATGAGNVLVTRAVQTLIELIRPIAAENEMGMAINQARRDAGAGCGLHMR